MFIRPIFPFTAIIGQPDLQQALLLVAIDQGLGGVLISGPRGTAKSTAARALAELLPEGQFVTLPLSSTDEHVVGTLDLAHVLASQDIQFKPGLLARADRGVLYVDEINLLADGLVDILLDVATSGVNVIERDGISHVHDARFILVGTMNPEEGELRPQLLDRFGLMVEIKNCFDPDIRRQIIDARFAFDMNPSRFCDKYNVMQDNLSCRIRDARERLSTVKFHDTVHSLVSNLCIAAAVDGLRADIVMLRAARALAAFDGQDIVSIDHVERVAESVLVHRRTIQKQNPSEKKLEASNQKTLQSHNAVQQDMNNQLYLPSESDFSDTVDQHNWGYLPPESSCTTTVKDVIPILFESSKKKVKPFIKRRRELTHQPPVSEKLNRFCISDSRESKTIAWFATLKAKRSETLQANHFRFHKRRTLLTQIHCLLLDSSASMLMHGRLARAKGLIISYFNRAARARIKIVLICFNGTGIVRHFGPAIPRWWNERWLTTVKGGGGTPLTDGINAAAQLLANSARRDPYRRRLLCVLSDGYTSEIPNRPDFADHMVFVDFDTKIFPIGCGDKLAAAWNAQWLTPDEMLSACFI